MKKYRVVQWGTGNVGIHSLRHLIQHPQFDVVACTHTVNPNAAAMPPISPDCTQRQQASSPPTMSTPCSH
jgi:uncharacterized protein YbjT (DUF2867 family)